MKIIAFPPAKTFTFRRLRLLEAKYNLHILLNEAEELATAKVFILLFNISN
jgi:hypothetical protein